MEPTDFSAFWALYPRRVAKKAAEKAWGRVATSPEMIEQIMAGLRAQLPAMLKKEKEFVPHPATWLNQQRFEDDTPGKWPTVEHCGFCCDTGIRFIGGYMERCNCCERGQLPGLMTGPVDPRDLPPTEPERDAP